MTCARETEQPAAATPLLRNRDYNLWLGGNVLSQLGSAASTLAYPLLILWATGSAAQAGIVTACHNLGSIAGGIPAGVLADRISRRAIIVAASLVQLLAGTAVFAVVLTGHIRIPLLAAVALVQGLAGAARGAAGGPAIRRIVPKSQLRTAFARNSGASHAVDLVGPTAGGLLYGIARAVPFLADALSFLAVTVTALLLRTPLGPDPQERDKRDTRSSFRADLGEGMRFIRGSGYLRYMCVMAAGVNALAGGMLFLFVVALREHGAHPAVIGSCESIIGVMGLAGALLSGRMIRLIGGYRLVLVVCWAVVPATVAVAVLPGVPYAAAAVIGVIIFFITPANVALSAYEIQIIPDRLLARVQTTIGTAGSSISWLAPAVCGALADAFGTTVVFLGIAAGLAGLATLNHFVKDLRNIDDLEELEDGEDADTPS